MRKHWGRDQHWRILLTWTQYGVHTCRCGVVPAPQFDWRPVRKPSSIRWLGIRVWWLR